jgi:hypothetical protein
MHELHTAVMLTHCVGVGLAHVIHWKLLAPAALMFAGVVISARQVAKKRK